MKRFIIFFLIVIVLIVSSCPLPEGESESIIDSVVHVDYRSKSTSWTVLYYVDGDCNLEDALIEDIAEVSQGMESTEMINVIAFVDRIPGYSSDSSVLGSDFTDSRLFRIGAGEVYALEGWDYFSDVGMSQSGEYNMGDAETLKSFIEYGKTYYPADNYALIFSNHGSGVRGSSYGSYESEMKGGDGLSGSSSLIAKAVCYDDTNDEDALYTAELTDVLDDSHSVDLLVYDACLMGLVEIAYEYRPGVAGEFSVDYMAASVPNVWNDGLPYDLIFSRISETQTGGTESYSSVTGISVETQYFNPATMTPEEFGTIIVEEQQKDTQQNNPGYDQSFSLYDLSHVESVVSALDDIGIELQSNAHVSGGDDTVLDNIRSNSICIPYSTGISAPQYDLYGFATCGTTNPASDALKNTLADEVDAMVIASFGEYANFDNGQDGLGFFFPDGNATYNGTDYWYYQWWYTGIDVNAWWTDHYYGNLDFCHADGNGTVDGWFEMLQYIYNNPYDSSAHPGQW